MTGCIVGWAHTKFGKHEGVELETLVVDAATEALVDAGVVPDLPAQADEEPVPEGPVLPETGEGAPIE